MKKTVLVCGLIAGLICSLWFFIAIATGEFNKDHFEMGMVYGYGSMLLGFSLIFVAIRSYREKHLGGHISFGKAFLIGLYITLIASTLYVVSWLIYYYTYAPDFMDQYMSYMVEQLQKDGETQAYIDMRVAEMRTMSEMYKNPVWVVLFTYVEILPVGLLLSLIAALILKKRSRTGEAAAAN